MRTDRARQTAEDVKETQWIRRLKSGGWKGCFKWHVSLKRDRRDIPSVLLIDCGHPRCSSVLPFYTSHPTEPIENGSVISSIHSFFLCVCLCAHFQAPYGDRQCCICWLTSTWGCAGGVTVSASHSHSTLVVNVPDASPLANELIKRVGVGDDQSKRQVASHKQSSCAARGVTLSSGCCAAVFMAANGSDDMLRQLVYFTSQAALPLFMGAETTERDTHDQAFPQRAIRIMSDSGCLGAHALTIGWLWDL